jgi:hypothetical protein
MTDSNRTSARLLNSIRKAKETERAPTANAQAGQGADTTTTPRQPTTRTTAVSKAGPTPATGAKRSSPSRSGSAKPTKVGHRLTAVLTPHRSGPDADPYSRGARVWPD